MSYGDWVTLRNFPVPARGAAFTTFTTVQNVYGSSTIPDNATAAQELVVGSAFRLTAFGVYSTTATPTLQLGFGYGAASTNWLTIATTTGSGVSNLPWRCELTGIVRAVGTSGSIEAQGFCVFGTSVSAATLLPIPGTALAAVTADTTVSKAWMPVAAWSASAAGNSVTTWGFLVENL